MRAPVDFDDLEGWQVSARRPQDHRRAAATLVSWAEQPHPDDEATPADLLSAAAWHLDQAGDSEQGLELHRRAVTAEGTTTPDARCLLAAALFEAGRPGEARQVAEDLRRSRPGIADVAAMAEVFEIAGDLQQAHRWVAMGVNRVELAGEGEPAEDFEVMLLLITRRRVRRALGFPPDDLDQVEE
jgi:hypothetical protein